MKTKVLLVVAALGFALVGTPASAAADKTLVIIDSGINKNLPWVANAVIEEACFIEFGKCPNGLATMTGPGAAHLDPALVKDRALSHGTQMASVAVATNPNVKIVFVRIVGMSAKGFANTYTTKALAQAMTWVNENAARLNVGAVSISLGRVYSEASCPVAAEPTLQPTIASLAAANIPTVIAAGNNSDKVKVNYPACIPDAIAVGATDNRYTVKNIVGWVYPVMHNSNGGPDLDIYAHGRFNTSDVTGKVAVSLGTSNANTAVATRLAQSLSVGGTLADTMAKVQASFQNAYRTAAEPLKFFFQT
jgi:hypothetical protein